MVGAHRGCRSIRPENTKCAFEASLGRCHYIELDVQISRDGIPVIHHDDELGRTCNLNKAYLKAEKDPPRIDSLELAELREFDFGSWFLTTDPFSSLAKGLVEAKHLTPLLPQPILTLKELLEWRNVVQIPLNIEIKDQEGNIHDNTIVDTVLRAVREAGCADQILISSFRHDYLRQVVLKMPGIPVGVLQEGHHPDDLLQYLRKLGASAYHPDVEITSEALIRELRQNGFGVNIFTVNDAEVQRQLLRDGATSVITDFPDLAVTDM